MGLSIPVMGSVRFQTEPNRTEPSRFRFGSRFLKIASVRFGSVRNFFGSVRFGLRENIATYIVKHFTMICRKQLVVFNS